MLIEILSEEDTVSAADLERAAERQRERGGSLAEWLLRIGVLAEDDLFFLLSRRLGVPPIPEERLRHLTLAPELRRRVPRGFAEQWVVLPLDVDVAGASLSVAMLDPSDESTLEALRLRARVSRVRTYLARRSVILAAIERVYDAAEAEHDLDRTEPPPRLMAAVPGRRDEVFGLAAELAPTFARDDGGDGGLGDLRPGDTQVSMIPGKVEIDPMLAQEIAALGEGAVDDDDDGLDDAELFATRIKKVPSNELPAARHALQQPARRPAGMPPVPPPTRFNPGEERQLHGRSLLADARGGAPLDNSRTAALQRVPSASPPPIPPETPAPEPLTPEPEPASSEVSSAAAAAAAAAARREAWHQTQKFKVEQHTEELEIDEDEVVMALDRAEAARAARERELELEHELDRPQSDLTPRVERSDLSSLFDAPVAARLPRDDDDDATGEHQAVGVAHADTLPANRSAAAASIAATESFRENAARTLLNMPAAVDDDVAAAAADDDDDDDDKTPRPTTGVDVLEPVLETIMHDLFGAVGVLSSMLEERIDPGGALSREYARISRLVARQCGMTDLEISRVALAAHLCGLDVALRSELGAPGAARVADVASIFAAKPSTPGGLNPTLRSVGARALGLDASASPGDDHDPRDLPFAAQLVSTVSDYIELRAESEEQGGDMETVLQLMRASGADPELLDVLQRAVETEHEATQTSRTPPTRHEQ